MDVRKSILTGAVAMLPATLMAESFLSEAHVTYRGSHTAKHVCRAIVNDDVESLERQLKQEKRKALWSYRLNERSDAVIRSVTCNGMELLTFADEIGARSVSSYLGGGTVTIEEVVVIGKR